ncbi:hypothetical protein QUF72_01075 [Desulfobacterales bacterium HSG2]|nr:hypothetical protein [Desulfobacterales bacterium HSG2]
MKLVHIFRSEPVPDVLKLVEILSEGNETTRFELYGDEIDYDRLVELIFSSDKVVSWW